MTSPLGERWQSELDGLNPSREGFAVGVVDRLLAFARDARASDVHLLPQLSGKELHLSLRVDGVLHRIGTIQEGGVNVVARLKVLAGLLTYRTDIPQEGRIRSGQEQLEMRVSSFPTVHGEKVVVRMFVGSGLYRHLEELGFPDSIYEALTNVLQEPQGLIVVCGPSGSGKTTTLYAALRHIQANSPTPRSIVTLEDPVEAVIPGISQSQVKPDGEFNYQRGLASLMRQDAEVILVGEIRDPKTAEIAFQAALTGQLVLTSFHAGSAAEAISRLSDMAIEPFVLRSSLRGILSQRLLRAKCQNCADPPVAAGCETCGLTGYAGRFVVAEWLQPDGKGLGRAMLDRLDAHEIETLAIESGMRPLRVVAQELVTQGRTTEAEWIRVFGAVPE